jgi:hypothetical protein
LRRLPGTLVVLASLLCTFLLSAPQPAAAAGPVAAPAQPDSSGLRVQISSITPSTLRSGGAVRISATVTNTKRGTWQGLQAFLVISELPMTTQQELAAAVVSDPEIPIGDRIIEPGLFNQLGNLAGGGVRAFDLRVPVEQLPISGAPGVYWLGVHILGTPPNGINDDVADARARTFIPLVPPGPATAGVDLALLWPITAAVPQVRSGAFTNNGLGRALSPNGRLSELLLMAQTAPPGRLSWLLDPALISAAASMSTGYVITGGSHKRIGPSAVSAQSWLNSLRSLLSGRTVLTLPYGDPDATALVHGHVRGILPRAVAASRRIMDAEQLASFPVLWPANGLADRRTLDAGERADTSLTLLNQLSLPGAERSRSVLSVETGSASAQTLVADSALVAGGPRPGRASGVLQVRQRLLAETALLALSGRAGKPATAIAAMPRDWDPGQNWAAADFFAGLRVPWLRLAQVTDLLTRTPGTYAGDLHYPKAAQRAELGGGALAQTKALRRGSTKLVALLTEAGAARRGYDRALGASASVHWRTAPRVGRAVNSARVDAVQASLKSVNVQTSSFVTLSSATGRFPVTITNGLRDDIEVGLSIRPDDPGLDIAPVQPVTVQSGQRTTITVTARAERIGLTNVTVRPVTADGRAFGRATSIDVRATQYGVVGWILVGLAVAVLFLTSARRIVRRLLAHRAAASGPQ